MTLRRRLLRGVGRLYLWATHRLYNEFASLYDLASWIVSAGRWASWRRIALDYVTGPRVLEVGFGTGELLIGLAGRGLSLCGVDPSAAMQRVTGRKLGRLGLEVPRLQGVAQALPFADGTFDTLISTFPAEYIVDPAALREMSRVLRCPGPDPGDRGGRLVVVGLVLYRVPRPDRLWFAPALPRDPAIERLRGATPPGLIVSPMSRLDGGTCLPVIIAERTV